MAVPKSKVSKQRTNTRFANFKTKAPTLVECPHCHEMKQSHRICLKCGYYNDEQVITQREKKSAE